MEGIFLQEKLCAKSAEHENRKEAHQSFEISHLFFRIEFKGVLK